MKARAVSRPLGFLHHTTHHLRLEKRPLDEFAHAQQRRLEGRHIEALHELIEQAGVAKGDE